MPIYVVVSMPPDALADEIGKIQESDRHEVAPGTWSEVGGIKVTLRDVATKQHIDLAVEKLKNRIMVGATIGTLAVIGWLVTWIIRLSTT